MGQRLRRLPQVLASVLRICTHPKIYRRPSTSAETLAFCEALLEPAHSTLVQPGERHWSIFAELCRSSKTTGNLVQDAWFAALAIEHGCEWISPDADYDRFRGLRWHQPFA
jgi:toxin-antitoxin system PIN domain toxin